MKGNLTLLLLAIFFIVSLERCKHSATEEVIPVKISGGTNNPNPITPPHDTLCFSSDILPLVLATCAKPGCHDAATHKDGYNFTNYTNIRNAIALGNPSQSIIYYYAKYGSSQMRNTSQTLIKLDTASLSKIAKWINSGAINSICNNCDTVNVKYSTHIQPIITQNCLGCHSSTGTLLTNYTQVKAKVTDGKLYCSITWSSGCLQMPQGGAKLSDCKIRAIKMWIDSGAPNN